MPYFFTKETKQPLTACHKHTNVTFKENCVGTGAFLLFLSANNSQQHLIEALLHCSLLSTIVETPGRGG